MAGLLDQKLRGLLDYIQANTPRNTRQQVSPGTVMDQGLFGGAVGRIPENANRMMERAQQAPAELAALASPQMRQKFDEVMANPPNPDKQQWFDAGMELSGLAPVGGLMAHTVYHGSPHKFDKFDMSKIGTGEGAQAYGHGLYFSEAQKVADEYAGKLSDPVIDFSHKTPETELEKTILNNLLEEAKTIQYGSKSNAVYKRWQNMAEPVKDHLYGNSYVGIKPLPPDQLAERLALRDAALGLGVPSVSDTGNLYKVDIPDESIPRMLDWDKPLSEQAPEVQAIFGSSPTMTGQQALRDISANPTRYFDKTMTGKELTGAHIDPVAGASTWLKQQGIPGIRYLDGNSRGAGGTSNFVLFDDQLPRILETNGQPTGLLSYADEAAKKTKKAKKK